MVIPRIDPRLVTLDYLARRIGVAPRVLRQLADDGQIPCIRTRAGDYLADAEAVQAVLLERARQTPAKVDR